MDERKLVAVMGPTGSGKSSFVKGITGCESVKVGRGLHSETAEIFMCDTVIDSTCFTLIDTPGFDDTNISDHDVLGVIADWLKGRYEAGQLLTGIFYLQPITKNRAEGSTLRSLALLEKLCGSKNFKNILLITTFWNQVSEEVGARREREMLEMEGFWKSMKEQGAKTERMARDYDRFKIALSAMADKPCISLQIQEELHDGKALEETLAGLSINADARKMKEEHERSLEETRIRAREELAKRDKLLEAARKKEAERQERLDKEAERRAEDARKAERIRMHQLEQIQERNRRIRQAELDRQTKEEERKQAERQRWQEKQALQAKAARLAAETKDGYECSLLQRDSIDQDIEYIRSAAQAGILRNEIDGIAPSGHGMSDGINGFSVDRSGLNHWCDICQNPIGARRKIICTICPNGDGHFNICEYCFFAKDFVCLDPNHKLYEDNSLKASNACRRLREPLNRLDCDRCANVIKGLYFHCCECDGDDFDICVTCVLAHRGCRNDSHILQWGIKRLQGTSTDVAAREEVAHNLALDT